MGAGYAAGLAVEFWNESKRWEPAWSAEQRDEGYARWKKAVERTPNWVDVD